MSTTTTAGDPERRSHGPRVAARAALDVMLTDAAFEEGGARRFIKPIAAAKVAAGLARHPDRVMRRAGGLGRELATTAAGLSQTAPAKGDRRFADRAWQESWLLRRLLQSYLATAQTVDGLISDAELDWRTERQARFAATNVLDALAPTNFPWSNPVVLRESIDQGGANLARGARQFVRDVSRPPRLPASVDTSKFEVGGNLAATPGSVVLRTEVFELIQYTPQTERVLTIPLLLVPPTINRYYILDIAPGRSMIEYLVREGQQVFVVSWRNPGSEQGHFDIDTYAQAVLEARDAVAEITKQDAIHVNAACSGGIVTAAAAGHLQATGELAKLASLTLFVCAIDSTRATDAEALVTREMAAAAVAESARKGYLDGQALAGVFAWLRPNDMVWNYVVNNYLLGKEPPAFDILYWNQDAVRLAAGLHRDFILMGLENSMATPGEYVALGTPIDLGSVDVDTYVVAGLRDHLVSWEAAYRSALLFGGRKRFVLSTSGHIQALVNPPSPESRSSYRMTEKPSTDPQEFFRQADVKPGSWWPDYSTWLRERSGALRPAPRVLGSKKHKAAARAPGTYVHAA
jgi:poly[(R)-3-hydroxyalkanoate] polymerase subunit PhaC